MTIEPIKYGEHVIDVATLPEASVAALLRRGISHYLGNEQAAKVSGAKDKYKTEHKVDMPDAEVASVKADFVAKAIEALTAGTIGSASRGPSIDPLEKVMRVLAAAEVRAILKANKIAVPKKGEAVEFADGTKKTLDDMVDSRVEREGDRLMDEAQAVLDERAAKAKALKAAVAGTKPDDLGL